MDRQLLDPGVVVEVLADDGGLERCRCRVNRDLLGQILSRAHDDAQRIGLADRDTQRHLNGLLAGRSFVTNGPMLTLTVKDLRPGDRKAIRGSRPVRITAEVEAWSVSALERVELIANGKVVGSRRVEADHAPGEISRCRFEFQVSLDGTSWVAARCFEVPPPDNVRFAHTGPVFFDDPSRPLLPERRQIDWLIDSVTAQIERVRGKLAEPAVDEYRQALEAYKRVVSRIPTPGAGAR